MLEPRKQATRHLRQPVITEELQKRRKNLDTVGADALWRDLDRVIDPVLPGDTVIS